MIWSTTLPQLARSASQLLPKSRPTSRPTHWRCSQRRKWTWYVWTNLSCRTCDYTKRLSVTTTCTCTCIANTDMHTCLCGKWYVPASFPGLRAFVACSMKKFSNTASDTRRPWNEAGYVQCTHVSMNHIHMYMSMSLALNGGLNNKVL